jgi:hypothetical protein
MDGLWMASATLRDVIQSTSTPAQPHASALFRDLVLILFLPPHTEKKRKRKRKKKTPARGPFLQRR